MRSIAENDRSGLENEAGTLPDQRGEGRIETADGCHRRNSELQTERLRSALQIVQLVVSIRQRELLVDVTGDPWNGRSLEWSTASPPPLFNFAVLPNVEGEEAYWVVKQRAIEQADAAGTLSLPATAGGAVEDQRCPAPADFARAAADLPAEYRAYLEQRVVDQERRITSLEIYLSGLWGVQLRRWVGSRLHRHRT